MNVDDLVLRKWKAKEKSIFPAYNTMGAATITIDAGEIIMVDTIKRDDVDNEMVIVMCKVDRIFVKFIIALEQLKNNFIMC